MLDIREVKSRLALKEVFIGRREFAEVESKVGALRRFRRRMLMEQSGWTSGCFALPSAQVFAPPGVRATVLFEPMRDKCARAGSLQGWLHHVAEPLRDQSLAMFMLMAAFVAPILKLTHRTGNLGFELCGPPGTGKTTLLHLMATTVGNAVNGDARPYWSTCNTTVNALEHKVEAHSDLPLLLDDATMFAAGQGGAARAQQFKSFVFSLAQGETKARFNTQQQSFRTAYFITTNTPLGVVISGLGDWEGGATADRLLSLDVGLRDNGIFDRIPRGYPDATAFARTLVAGMAANYGTAMPQFLERLVCDRSANEEALRSRIRRDADDFLEMAQVDRSDGSAVRVAEAFGFVMAAGQLAQDYGALPTGFDCEVPALDAYRLFLASTQRQSPLERLIAYSTAPGVMDLDNADRWLAPDLVTVAPGFWRTHPGGQREFLVWPDVFKRAFPDWRRVIADGNVASIMPRDSRHRGVRRHLRRRFPQDRFYCFRLTSPGSCKAQQACAKLVM